VLLNQTFFELDKARFAQFVELLDAPPAPED